MGSGVGFTAALVRNSDDSELGREMLSKAQLGTVIMTQPHYRGRISHRSSADNSGFQRLFSWPFFFFLFYQKVGRKWIFYICCWDALSPDMQNQLCPGGKASDIALQSAKLSAEKRKALPGNLAVELWYRNPPVVLNWGFGAVISWPGWKGSDASVELQNKGC